LWLLAIHSSGFSIMAVIYMNMHKSPTAIASLTCRKTLVFRHPGGSREKPYRGGYKYIRKTLSPSITIRKHQTHGFPLMLVGYMRVSSDSDRQTTDLQRDALLAEGVDARHLFEDHASGARDDRPGLAKALEFVRSGDVLIVWKLDRLGRSLTHLLTIVNTLKGRQVAFRSLTEGMDTTTASGELLFHVFGALAQYERALTRERVVAGLAAARRRGRVGGRPPAIVGEKLEAIMSALSGGMSKAAICRNFGVKRTTLIETLARAGGARECVPSQG
jgi:DNA invertase Pin-like site-specific DNA recombinase